jgi:formate dehydrogenase maturation protein FdhE
VSEPIPQGPYTDMTPFGHCGPCPECTSTAVENRVVFTGGRYYHCAGCYTEWVTPTEAQLAPKWRQP